MLFKLGLVSHRGLHGGDIVENTLLAFKRSLEENLPIELDIRMLRDKELFVFHDKNLLRLCGKDKDIEALSSEEAAQIKIFGKDYGIPTLAGVLELVNGRQPLVIEVKTSEDTDRKEICIQLMNLLNEYQGKVFVMSFDLEVVRLFDKMISQSKKEIPVGLLGGEDFSLTRRLREIFTACDFVGYHKNFAGSVWLRFLARRRPVFLWTFRSKAEAKESLELGHCDGAMFEERPGVQNQKIVI